VILFPHNSNASGPILVIILLQIFATLLIHSCFFVRLLHFAWVVDDAKCIVITCVCLCVCVSVRGRTPTLLNGPGCNLGAW